METTAVQGEKNQRLWSVLQIGIAAYIGGPVTGCYFLGRNYDLLGYPKESERAYIAGLIGAFIYFTINILMPLEGAWLILSFFTPLLSVIPITKVARRWQK